MKQIPVSIYFVPEWWDRHYHCNVPRPAQKSTAELESMYLGRQRFLFESFGEFKLGSEHPDLSAGQIATVIRFGYDLVPVLLGTEFELLDAWELHPRYRTLEEMRGANPVDISNHPAGEWIIQEKERICKKLWNTLAGLFL